MFEITKETIIADIMMNAPETQPLFRSIGMHCMGCALASGENLEQACMAHGVDVDNFLERCNEVIADFAIAEDFVCKCIAQPCYNFLISKLPVSIITPLFPICIPKQHRESGRCRCGQKLNFFQRRYIIHRVAQ